ncbi:hypothetical protein [Bordetella sp. LUAb4]|uniref:hypothetical protein n=1 Tax=Bordetella sp. LUAb4 TaxID=2843195 RepID=UPI001E652E42|nr:hypothetical protein [Bordetella sp. LUAb4]
MSTHSEQIFTAGEKVLNAADCEADLRAAIGRFYYSVHHQAKAFHRKLKLPGMVKMGGGSHIELCSQLMYPTIPPTDPLYLKSKRLGVLCKALLTERIRADYRLDEDISIKDANGSRDLATEALKIEQQ